MAFLGFLWLPGDLPGGPGKNPDTGWMCTPMEVPNWRHRIGSCCVGCLRLECKAFSIWKAQQCGEERGASSNTLGVVAINFSGNSRVGSSRTPHSPLFPTRWLMSEHAAFPGSDLALHKTDPPSPPPESTALQMGMWERCRWAGGWWAGGGRPPVAHAPPIIASGAGLPRFFGRPPSPCPVHGGDQAKR